MVGVVVLQRPNPLCWWHGTLRYSIFIFSKGNLSCNGFVLCGTEEKPLHARLLQPFERHESTMWWRPVNFNSLASYPLFFWSATSLSPVNQKKHKRPPVFCLFFYLTGGSSLLQFDCRSNQIRRSCHVWRSSLNTTLTKCNQKVEDFRKPNRFARMN